MAWAGQRGREKDRNFNASCQSTEKVSAIVRRMGWAVILRGESGPRRSGSVGFGGLVGGELWQHRARARVRRWPVERP